MFTGLIKDLGNIVSVVENKEGRIFEIQTNLVFDIEIGDSVSVNGCCLTVTQMHGEIITVQAVHVTLQKTTLQELLRDDKVNLELALRLSERLGGHLVQGHVNCTANLNEVLSQGENYQLWFEIPLNQMKYIIKEGSIAISGISLTVADIKKNLIMITIIPHTWNHTNLKHIKIGSSVNIEVDMMAKYFENFSKYQETGL